MSKKEVQQPLPGIPQATPLNTYRVNFQYQGPNYALRAGSLIIPALDIQNARLIANGTLKDQYGDKWFNINKIVTIVLSDDQKEPF